MAINIFTDQMQHAQLFGKPVLTTNWLIPRETVPDGWWCYECALFLDNLRRNTQ